jgi:uncharacterized protein
MTRARFLGGIREIAAADWNALAPPGHPFLRHEYLAALEDSGSVGGDSGWQAHHLLLQEGSRLLAAMPCYLKQHSWGEYVFDWSWADAYRRHGLSYYPKLVSAVPFTPAAGPRLLLAEGVTLAAVREELLGAIASELGHLGASSWHLLFPERPVAEGLAAAGLGHRTGVQFHWHNRGYRDFEDFLDALQSRKRKQLRRERRVVAAQGLEMRALRGSDVDAALWDRFHHFYQLTYARRSGHGGYLSREFFGSLGRAMPDALLLVIALQGREVVAGALNVIGGDTLYGRYWGASEEFAQLHFEACYYQGIDFCIREGLARFDAGAQGEHKLARGFEPVVTHSCHLIAHPAFRAAIGDFLLREREAVEDYRRETAQALPFGHGRDGD